jgi:hypothetical protein
MVALMAALRTISSARRLGFVMAALVAAVTVVACTEDYEGGAACPALCPEQNVVVIDTTFDPVVLDTTVFPFPTTGTETELLLARRGDTVDTRPVIRFDSLRSTTTPVRPTVTRSSRWSTALTSSCA